MAEDVATGTEGQSVSWWTPPGETDTTAYAALILLFLLIFLVVHLYARFDRFAEKHNEGTPLKTTIPTLLLIAFAYEIFPPLSHFSILLPLALIATALARDLMLWFEPTKEHILKGEIEDALLDELQAEHIGEHDHLGRRITKTPARKPQAGPRPKSKPSPKADKAVAAVKKLRVASEEHARPAKRPAPAKSAAPATGGTEGD